MGIAARCLHGAGVCVIPSSSNNYKPLALRHKPLAAISALLILSKVLAIGLLALIPAQAQLSTITTARIIQLTNQERESAGLQALKTSPALTQAALEKSNNMLEEDYFAHISSKGVTPWFWIDKAGYKYVLAGENLAIDFFEAEDVVQAWLNSPTHKENMLHPAYTETGVAVATGEFQGGTSIVVVHMFGTPPGGVAAAQQSEPEPEPEPETAPAPLPPAPTHVSKDTTGPELKNDDFQFVIGPISDEPVAVVIAASQGEAVDTQPRVVSLRAGSEVAVTGSDSAGNLTQVVFPSLLPQFATEDNAAAAEAPLIFSSLSRRLAVGIAATVLVLLVLAIFIRIQVQHPSLITRAALVVLLAGIVFWL